MSYEKIVTGEKIERSGSYKEKSLKERAEYFGIATDFPTSRARRREDLKMAVREERKRKKDLKVAVGKELSLKSKT